jgi:hypothetical protein
MILKDALTALLLGLVGILAAAGIAVAVNRVSGEEIGLGSKPVSVIPANATSAPRPAPGPAGHGADQRGSATFATVDDNGGASGSSGSGGGSGSSGSSGSSGVSGTNSGSGSSGSGSSPSPSSGNSDSGGGSSGSSSSGKGSDDSGSGSGSGSGSSGGPGSGD